MNLDPAGKMLEALARALKALRAHSITDGAIHDARKDLKTARASLRLLRATLGDTAYQKENEALRNAGRCLSPIRDSKAVLGAYDALRSRYAEELRGAALGPVRALLNEDLVRARREMARPSPQLNTCIRLIEAHERRLRKARALSFDRSALLDSLRRLYRKGREARETAEKTHVSLDLHEWRKQVKYLLNALEGLEDTLGHRAKKLSLRAHKLADRLGDDHDLAVLSATLSEHASVSAGAGALQPFIARRRAKLQEHASRLGKKLYEQKPRRFVADLMR